MFNEYPPEGEYGDPRPRCEWCGRTYRHSALDPLGQNPYCSYECRMAGLYELGKGLLGIFLCLAVLSTIPMIDIILRYGFVYISVIPIFLWIITAYFWRGVKIGRKMRGIS